MDVEAAVIFSGVTSVVFVVVVVMTVLLVVMTMVVVMFCPVVMVVLVLVLVCGIESPLGWLQDTPTSFCSV